MLPTVSTSTYTLPKFLVCGDVISLVASSGKFNKCLKKWLYISSWGCQYVGKVFPRKSRTLVPLEQLWFYSNCHWWPFKIVVIFVFIFVHVYTMKFRKPRHNIVTTLFKYWFKTLGKVLKWIKKWRLSFSK